MGILSATLSLLLLVPAPQAQTGPSPEAIAAYRKELEAALEPGVDPKVWQKKILISRDYQDSSVIAVLDAKALRHEDRNLRDTAVNALGHMRHPDARKVLVAMFARDEKELEKEPPRYANLVRAIARNGDASVIPLLVKDVFQSGDRNLVQARILGLGNVRAKESVDELIQLMRSAPRPRVADVMLEMRTALFMLTGVDKGTDQELWINWYGDAKNSLTIAPEPPVQCPQEVRRCWTTFWGPSIASHRLGEKGLEPRTKGKGKAKRAREQGEDEQQGEDG
jgi:HEAT repeat protein